jgi:hypothetical protein
VGDIHRIFVQTVFGSLRRRAGDAGKNAKCGAVTFIQRFGNALNLNLHFHIVAIDDAYTENGNLVRYSGVEADDNSRRVGG